MSRGRFSIFLLCFWSFWAAVVVPGHVRGVITLDTDGRSGCTASANAAFSSRACCDRSSRSEAPARPSNCAVCFNAQFLASPPPPTRYEAYLGPVFVAPVTILEVIVVVDSVREVEERGPPASAAFSA
jgi:hypothetical protein